MVVQERLAEVQASESALLAEVEKLRSANSAYELELVTVGQVGG